MTTIDELTGLRKTARVAADALATAAERAGSTGRARAEADDRLAGARRRELAAGERLAELAQLANQRDAALGSAADDDVRARAADTATAGLGVQLFNLSRELERVPPDSPVAQLLRDRITVVTAERDEQVAAATAARAAADIQRSLVAQLTAAVDAGITPAQAEAAAAAAELAEARTVAADAGRNDEAATAALAQAETAEWAVRVPYQAALDGLLPSASLELPLLLFPVRIETRYDPPRLDGSRDLLIRVYPDEVHQDTHSAGLTPDEQVAGKEFWTEVWAAGQAEAGRPRRASAWQRLSARFGPYRSAWLVTALTPTNLPASASQPQWPPVVTAASRWSRAAHTVTLPDRWLAFGVAGGRVVFQRWGEPIQRPLDTGPAPDEEAPKDEEALGAGAGMRWMVDFGAAVDVGMGLRVPLAPTDPTDFDLVGIVGVQATSTPAEAADAVVDLLDAHAYTWGADLVPVGTPTNNDGRDVTAGYAVRGRSAAGDEDRLLGAPAAATGDGGDADLLASALGIEPRPSFWRAPHAAEHGQRDAQAMATVLWPATWGYYLRQMLAPEHETSPVDRWRRSALDLVRSRGPLPVLRLGAQPYGVLPITASGLYRHAEPSLVGVRVTVGFPPRVRAALDLSWRVDLAADAGGTTSQLDPPPVSPAELAGCVLTLAAIGDDLVTLLLRPGSGAAAATLTAGPAVDGTGTASGSWSGAVPVPKPAAPLGAELALAAGSLPAGEAMIALVRQVLGQGQGARLGLTLGTGLRLDGTVEDWQDLGETELPDQPPGRLLAAALGVAAPTAANVANGRWVVALTAEPPGQPAGLSFRLTAAAADQAPVWTAPDTVPLPAGTTEVDAVAAALVGPAADGRVGLVVWVQARTATGSGRWLVVGRDLREDGRMAGGWTDPSPFGDGGLAVTTRLALAVAPLRPSPLAPPYSPHGLTALLSAARDRWLEQVAAQRVPYAGRGDPDEDVLRILGTDAVSSSLGVRRLIGLDYLLGLYQIAQRPPPGSPSAALVAQTTADLRAALGLGPADRRLQRGAYADPVVEVDEPWVQRGPLSDVDPLAEDYLTWAAKADPARLHERAVWPGRTESLLRRLVRHSTLQAYADVAFRLAPPPQPWHEPELVDVPDILANDPRAEETLTSWRYLSKPQLGRQLDREVVDRVSTGDPVAADLTELLAALRHLATLPTASLQRLLGETLDLSVHRLDAWITAVATARLRSMRAARPAGVVLGGYGLVERLSPAGGRPASTGFVHAPSLAHATTAAVLRSGYLSHQGSPAAAGLAVDLSSARVRTALELLDGVRAGQPLGALLGYRFERLLQEDGQLGLARFVPAFRQLAPLTAGKLVGLGAGTPVDAVAAPTVCDGLALVRLGGSGVPWGTAPAGQPTELPTKDSPLGKALATAIRQVADAVDAVSDLGLAESVFQATQGNPGRIGGTLDALNRGELPPPEPEVVRTARSGVAVTHRVLVALPEPDPGNAVQQAWAKAGGGSRVRAVAEPRLDAWAATLLGPPDQVRWQAAYGDLIETFTVADLGLAPLDVLHVGESGPDTDVERRLLLHASVHPPSRATLDGGVRLLLDRDPDWDRDVLTVPELLQVAAAVTELATAARPLTASDLLPPGATAGATTADDGLADRLSACIDLVGAAVTDLRELFDLADPTADRVTLAGVTGLPPARLAALTNLLDLPAAVDVVAAAVAVALPAAGQLGPLRQRLLAVADCGIPGAVPSSIHGESSADAATLVEQAAGAAREAASRLDLAGAADRPVAAFETLLGRDAQVLPVVTAANAAELAAAATERAAAQDAGPDSSVPWLGQLAEVRDGVARLDAALLVAEATTGGPAARTSVLQLPAGRTPPQPWAALPAAGGARPLAGRLTLAVVGPVAELDQPVAGLLVDDWTEVVPSDTETTALAFHLDTPDASPPQTLLLAVPPVAGRPWTERSLTEVVREAYDLARLRAVDPDNVPEQIGHFLPALLLACNVGADPDGDTISTVFPPA